MGLGSSSICGRVAFATWEWCMNVKVNKEKGKRLVVL